MVRQFALLALSVMLGVTGFQATAQTEFKVFTGQGGELSSVADDLIRSTVERLDRSKFYEVTLRGYTDTRGTSRAARDRTAASIQAVENELRMALIGVRIVSTENLADLSLTVQTGDNVGEPLNRYVSVYIVEAGDIPAAPVSQSNSGGFSLYSEAARSSNYSMEKANEAYVRGDFAAAIQIWEFHTKGGPYIADAASKLALAYVLGEGVEASQVEAFKYSLIAAKAGHSKSQLDVAKRLRIGLGTEKDLPQAKVWNYHLLTETGGDRDAQAHMGLVHADLGELRDALWYFEQAGEKGDVPSQYRAGLVHSGKFEGVEQNRSKARFWLTLAASNGDEGAADELAALEAEWANTTAPQASQADLTSLAAGFPVFTDTQLSPLGDAAASCTWVLQQAIEGAPPSGDVGAVIELEKRRIYLDLARKILLNPEHNGGFGRADVEAALAQHGIVSSLFGGDGPSLEDCEAARFLEAQ